ncbi:hypothetical protein [Natranaeroarchaeum aerophilus]|uniref:Uncharacterized protein n=1 Tax=Natranaeroarchaeum aerophilus TaxID=2917711 RepID=A0AAE3FPZ7_9EURY|nr:hypothetical protein [Natranaeroarchaeum aerophilus]MCL9812509.1 hypothetical protein [Natranaeroarchaeum aerophilus]
MSSDDRNPKNLPQTMNVNTEAKGTGGHLADLLIAFKWPITLCILLLVAGLSLSFIELSGIPSRTLRWLSLSFLTAFLFLLIVGPMVFSANLYITLQNATPLVIGDPDHKEVHCVLATGNSLNEFAFTQGLPRQRETDNGAGYVVLQTDDDQDDLDDDVRAVFDTPITESQPSWLELAETDRYQEWRKVRVDLTDIVQESVQQKQEMFQKRVQGLRDQANRLIAGVQSDVELSDIDELDDPAPWTETPDDYQPAGPDRLDPNADSAGLFSDQPDRAGADD